MESITEKLENAAEKGYTVLDIRSASGVNPSMGCTYIHFDEKGFSTLVNMSSQYGTATIHLSEAALEALAKVLADRGIGQDKDKNEAVAKQKNLTDEYLKQLMEALDKLAGQQLRYSQKGAMFSY